MSDATTFMLLYVWALAATAILLLVHLRNPYAIRIAMSKRICWIVFGDGKIEPVRAKLESVAYKTEQDGMFEFEREDVVYYGKIPGIIVYAPYAKALRPKVLPVLQILKKMRISRYDQLVTLLNAKKITKAEFEALTTPAPQKQGGST